MTDRSEYTSRPPRGPDTGSGAAAPGGRSAGRPPARASTPGPRVGSLATRVPADAVAVAAVVALAWLAATRLQSGALAIAVAAAFVLLVPGYALTAALFPAGSGSDGVDGVGGVDGTDGADGLAVPERVAYALALSLVVAPLVALALGATGVGIRPRPVVLALGAVSLGAMAVATVRRARLPAAERFASLSALRARDPDWLVLGVVAVAVLAAVGAGGYAAARPPAETFSALYLLSPGDDGGLVAAVPSSAVAGEAVPLVVGVDNREGRAATYTVVAVAARVDDAGRPVAAAEVGRWRAVVAADDTWRLAHEVTVPSTVARDGDGDGESEVRLAYYLFVGDAGVPAAGSGAAPGAVDGADYEVHAWIDVRTGGGPVTPP